MTTDILALILLIGFFTALCAWVWAVWPQESPFDDDAYERRHVRRPTPLGGLQPDFARRGDALCGDGATALRGSPDEQSSRLDRG